MVMNFVANPDITVDRSVRHFIFKAASLAFAVFFATSGQANETLARKSDCLGCHAVAAKLVGPSFRDVAAKYAGQPDAVEQVSTSIRSGGVGKWGEIPMPPHAKLSPADVKKLAVWVLNSK